MNFINGVKMDRKLLGKKIVKKIFLTLSVIILLSEIAKGGPKNSERPNIVFLIMDDMTKDLFNCLPEGKGKNYTPNIDLLANEGTILMNQHCASPVCTPSRFTCLTGNYASRSSHKAFLRDTKKFGQSVVEFNTFIKEDDQTVAKYLLNSGYRTGFVGKSHVVEDDKWVLLPYNSDINDAKVKGVLENNKKIVQEKMKSIGFEYAENIYYNNPEFCGPKDLSIHNMDWITEAAGNFLDNKDTRPFFLYFATTLPHYPSEPDRAWNADRHFTSNGLIENVPSVQPSKETFVKRLVDAGFEPNDRNCNLLWLDDAVGVVLKKLKDSGKLDNTIIFFFNDNGQGAKGTLYQGGIHNPSIVWKKGGFKSGRISNAKVSNTDFAPTILELAGVKYSSNAFDGKSFLPILNGNKSEIHESMYFEMGFTRAVIKGNYKYLALRYPDYAMKWSSDEKLKMLKDINEKRRSRNQPIANPEEDPTKPFSHITLLPGGNYAEFESTGKFPGYYDKDQLYDLSKDPGELNNLAGDQKYKNVIEDMKAELKKYINNLPGGFPLETSKEK